MVVVFIGGINLGINHMHFNWINHFLLILIHKLLDFLHYLLHSHWVHLHTHSLSPFLWLKILPPNFKTDKSTKYPSGQLLWVLKQRTTMTYKINVYDNLHKPISSPYVVGILLINLYKSATQAGSNWGFIFLVLSLFWRNIFRIVFLFDDFICSCLIFTNQNKFLKSSAAAAGIPLFFCCLTLFAI